MKLEINFGVSLSDDNEDYFLWVPIHKVHFYEKNGMDHWKCADCDIKAAFRVKNQRARKLIGKSEWNT